MLVAIGSVNPAKTKAVRKAFEKAFYDVYFEEVDSPSGVAHTPLSTDETRRGAENRARHALDSVKGADFGVGAEGGVQDTKDGLMLCGYVVVVSKDGRVGVGGGTELLLPKAFEKQIESGKELGDVVDAVSGEKNTKHRGGSVALLTKGMVKREEYFNIATAFALAPFVSEDLYAKK